MYRIDVETKKLIPLQPTTFEEHGLMERYDIQEWVDSQPTILGDKLMFIAKELVLPSGKRLDLLAVDSSGALIVVELKRDHSGSEVDWQAVKYASYCANFLEEDTVDYLADRANISPEEARETLDAFIDGGIEQLNHTQRIILCARDFHSDVASAVLWLREFGLDISCVRLEAFRDGDDDLYLNTTTIIPLPEARDYVVKRERKDAQSRKTSEYSGFFLINVGDGPHRNWDDCRKYGFLSAGHGREHSEKLDRLRVGDRFFAYLNGTGYVGCGEIVSEAVPMRDFLVRSSSKFLHEVPLAAPEATRYVDNDEMCEYVVGVEWLKTLAREEAIPSRGLQVLRSSVKRMRASATTEHLKSAFGVID